MGSEARRTPANTQKHNRQIQREIQGDRWSRMRRLTNTDTDVACDIQQQRTKQWRRQGGVHRVQVHPPR